MRTIAVRLRCRGQKVFIAPLQPLQALIQEQKHPGSPRRQVQLRVLLSQQITVVADPRHFFSQYCHQSPVSVTEWFMHSKTATLGDTG